MSFFSAPLLDGVAPSWADISVRISPSSGGGGAVGAVIGAVANAVVGNLLELGDIKAINTGTTVELGEQREGGRVIKRTRGSVSYEASMTLYASGWQKLIKGLLAVSPKNAQGQSQVSLVNFTVNVQYTPPGAIDILEYSLRGCRILGRGFNGAEGNDATEVEVPLSPIEIVDVVNGVEVVML